MIWDGLSYIITRLVKLESKSETYDILWEIRILEKLDNLVKTIPKELQIYGTIRVNV
jgi:hypothetical protein